MLTKQDLWNADEVRLSALYEAGHYARALRTLDESGLVAVLEEQSDAPAPAGLVLVVANLYRDLAQYTAAEQYYLQALAGLSRTLGLDHPGYARGLVELATLYELL